MTNKSHLVQFLSSLYFFFPILRLPKIDHIKVMAASQDFLRCLFSCSLFSLFQLLCFFEKNYCYETAENLRKTKGKVEPVN